jgi:hypothetical protein
MLRRGTLGTLLFALLGLLPACKDKPSATTPSPAASVTIDVSGPAARGEAVAFRSEPFSVGMKRRESDVTTTSMAMNIDAGGGQPVTTSMTMTDTDTETRELLAVHGNVATKVRVTFDRREQRLVENGKETQKPSRVAGKSYVVEAKDGKLEVRDPAGALVPKEEADEVAKHFESLGRPDPVASALPDSLRPGERVETVARSLREYLALVSGMTVSDVSVVFKERQGDEGVFTLAMTMAKQDERIAITISLAGEMRVSTRTKETTRVDLSGPLEVAPSASSRLKVDGSGTMTMKMTQTPL